MQGSQVLGSGALPEARARPGRARTVTSRIARWGRLIWLACVSRIRGSAGVVVATAIAAVAALPWRS